jgi:hypothetical protein
MTEHIKLGRPKDDERMITMDVDDLLLVNRTLGSVGALRALVEALTGKTLSWNAVDRYHSLIPVRQEISDTIEFALEHLRSVDKILNKIDVEKITGDCEGISNYDAGNLKDFVEKFFWKPL